MVQRSVHRLQRQLSYVPIVLFHSLEKGRQKQSGKENGYLHLKLAYLNLETESRESRQATNSKPVRLSGDNREDETRTISV